MTTEKFYNYYVKGATQEKPDIDISQNYYTIFYELGKIIIDEKLLVAKRFIGNEIFEYLKAKNLHDIEVEMALLLLCPGYAENLKTKITRFLSGDFSSSTFYAEDLRKELECKDLRKHGNVEDIKNWNKKYIQKLYTLIPQRFFPEDLKLRDNSLQLDFRQSSNSPFVLDKKYQQKQYTPNSLNDILSNLAKSTSLFHSHLETTLDISCIVAGGFVLNSLFKEIDSPKSDIDIFLVGEPNLRRKKIDNISSILMKEGYQMYIFEHVLTFEAEGKTPIQIINTNYRDPIQVIYGFDMSYVQIFYNGKDIYASEHFYRYTPFLEAKICRFRVLPKRIYKCLEKGFLPVSENIVMVNGAEVSYLTMHELGNEKVLFAKPNRVFPQRETKIDRTEISKLPEELAEKNLTDDVYANLDIRSFYECSIEEYSECIVECHSSVQEGDDIFFMTKMFVKNIGKINDIPSKLRDNDIFNKIKYANPSHCYLYLQYVEKTGDKTLENYTDFLSVNVKRFKKEAKIYENYLGISLPEKYDESFKNTMRNFFNENATLGKLRYGNKKQFVLKQSSKLIPLIVVNGEEVEELNNTLYEPLVYLLGDFVESIYGFDHPTLF